MDHFSKVIALARSHQQIMQLLRQEERGFHIQIHRAVPARFGKFQIVLSPSSACIIDKDIQLFLTLFKRIRQSNNTIHL